MPRCRPLGFSFVAPLAGIIAVLALLAGCAPPAREAPGPAADRLVLAAANYAALPGWAADSHGEALVALVRSCAKILPQPDTRPMGGAIPGTMADWKPACEAAGGLDVTDHEAARRYFETWFRPYAASNNGAPEGLFTGYFEPELKGAFAPADGYAVALYAKPPDLVTVDLGAFREALRGQRVAGRVDDGRLVPYPTRAEIDTGALAGKRLELVWVTDAVDAFFLHIQGSGRVVFEDGDVRRIGYAATNGHVYHAIGRTLLERGELPRENVSMQSIRAWLARNPGKAAALMRENRSYVFFRWLDESTSDLGPLGAQGVPLSARRSLAVDRRFVPLGTPIWLVASAPDPDPTWSDWRLRRLVVAQDTGGAIRGPVRGDLFWGSSARAAEVAGRMKHTGRYYLLLPRSLEVVAPGG